MLLVNLFKFSEKLTEETLKRAGLDVGLLEELPNMQFQCGTAALVLKTCEDRNILGANLLFMLQEANNLFLLLVVDGNVLRVV